MSSGKFDWRTDDEEGWEEPLPQKTPHKKRYSRVHIIAGSIIILFIVGLAVLGVLKILNNRLERETRLLEDEVRASHELLLQAIESYDVDLFETLLPSTNVIWHDLQIELLRRRLVLARVPLGIWPHLDRVDFSNIPEANVILGPELNTAEITELGSYIIESGEGVTQTVQLERVFNFRKDQNAWYYVPAQDDAVFWGEWLNEEGKALKLIFPERDADIGRRLAPMLDSLASELCGASSVECPEKLLISLKLDRSPRSLLRLGNGVYNAQIQSGFGTYLLTLPAPTLIGRPIDEVGFQTLYRGYAGWLASTLLISFSHEGTIVDDQYLAGQLARWNLRPPLRPQQILPRTVHTDLPAGIEAPDQDILLLCNEGSRLNLWRYRTDVNDWSDELQHFDPNVKETFSGNLASNAQGTLTRIPGQEGILVSVYQEIDSRDRFRTYLWREGKIHLLLDEEQPFYFFPGIWGSVFNRDSQHVIVYRPNSVSSDYGENPWWFNYQKCLENDCELHDSGGFPIWSPNGNRSINLQYQESDHLTLWLADSDGNTISELGNGIPSVWIDRDHFAYIRSHEYKEGESERSIKGEELVVVNVSDKEIQKEDIRVIVDLTHLEQFVSLVSPIRIAELLSAVPSPGESGDWLIAISGAVDFEPPSKYLLRYRPQQGTAEIITELGSGQLFPPIIGPDGRYVALGSTGEQGFRFQIFDVLEDELIHSDDRYPMDWSDDGQWLIFTEGGVIRTVTVGNDFEWSIPHDLQGCYSTVWIDQ